MENFFFLQLYFKQVLSSITAEDFVPEVKVQGQVQGQDDFVEWLGIGIGTVRDAKSQVQRWISGTGMSNSAPESTYP